MSDSKFKSPYRGVDRRAPRAATADADGADAYGADAYGKALKRGTKIGGRHAAITTDLYSWHSYKNWADKMRGSWGEKK